MNAEISVELSAKQLDLGGASGQNFASKSRANRDDNEDQERGVKTLTNLLTPNNAQAFPMQSSGHVISSKGTRTPSKQKFEGTP